MSEALNYFYYIFNKFNNFIFNDMELFNNVTFGWICISCLVFGILIKALLNLPSRISNDTRNRTEWRIKMKRNME